MNESVIGILGGLGPSATCSLFQKVIHATSVEKDQDHFRVLIDSNPKIPDRTAAILYGGESPVPMMVQTAQNLERAGANILLIPCMTAHYFYDQLISGVHVPFVNAFDVLAAHLGQSYPSLHTVGVLCTSGSKAADLFGKKTAWVQHCLSRRWLSERRSHGIRVRGTRHQERKYRYLPATVAEKGCRQTGGKRLRTDRLWVHGSRTSAETRRRLRPID